MKVYLAILLAGAAFGASLHDQTLAALLAREFPQPDLNYLLVDAQSRESIAARWPSQRTAAPAGSLVKPFTALAYAASHHFEYPVLVCRGRANGCWSAKPHGAVGIEEAIAQSCNAYFLALAARIGPEEIAATAEQFGLAPPQKDTASARIGLG
ncbi:MAG: penicillin-binding transpeptidase domain-containing protein, partial [Bryobacteraceae bacterium]